MNIFLSPQQISERWGVHRTNATRTMERLGFGGLKSGTGRGCMRRFRLKDVERAEEIMGGNTGGAR